MGGHRFLVPDPPPPKKKKETKTKTKNWLVAREGESTYIIDEQTHTVNTMDLQNLKVACAILISLQACFDGYGCVDPPESEFDAIGSQLASLSLSSGSVDGDCKFGRKLWRILRPEENPKAGLIAKDRQASRTVRSHVNCGGRVGYKSQFISTTGLYKVARYYKAKDEGNGVKRLRIAEISYDALPAHCKSKTVDLTTAENRDKYLGNAVCKNFAAASCEVLLQCDVPIPYRVVDHPEEKDSGEL